MCKPILVLGVPKDATQKNHGSKITDRRHVKETIALEPPECIMVAITGVGYTHGAKNRVGDREGA